MSVSSQRVLGMLHWLMPREQMRKAEELRGFFFEALLQQYSCIEEKRHSAFSMPKNSRLQAQKLDPPLLCYSKVEAGHVFLLTGYTSPRRRCPAFPGASRAPPPLLPQTMMIKAVVLAACVLMAQGFTLAPIQARRTFSLKASEEREASPATPAAEAPAPVAAPAAPAPASAQEEEERPGLFDKQFFQTPSTRGLIGVSRDEDGKSNIWAVQPKMVETTETQNAGRFLKGAGAAAAFVGLCVVVAALIPSADQLY
eukprot:scaffold47_cov258-Pinguiococcus_pyrenoidosus.AAC.3